MWTPFVVFAQPRDLRVEHSVPGRYRRVGLVRCAFVIAVCASLAACASVPGGSPKSDAERAYLAACSSLPLQYAAFQIYDQINDVGEKARRYAVQAYAGASAVCAKPMPTDLRSALATVAAALQAIATAAKK